jgi:CubicO group peptidase (beta-lactamase class C family)
LEPVVSEPLLVQSQRSTVDRQRLGAVSDTDREHDCGRSNGHEFRNITDLHAVSRPGQVTRLRLFAVCLVAASISLAALPIALAQSTLAGLPLATPESVNMRSDRLNEIDRIVQSGLDRNNMPGAVVLIARRGQIVFLRAYGQRRLRPAPEEMTIDTVFDMASITKPVATATSIMKLVETGKLDLQDPVAKYIPEFAANGKGHITILQLLTHQGGLIPDNSLKDYQDGPDQAFERIYALKTYVEPGSKFVYTDVGFIVLADLVQRVSGMNVHEFSQKHIYRPLGMTETGFLPPDELKRRCATTEQRSLDGAGDSQERHWMRGEVHDPRAYELGGIAGHAGLFSTASDLAVFGQMLISNGQYSNVRILKQKTVQQMTRGYTVSSGIRGLGWDKRTGYSSNRGDLLSDAAFGHGGFTGTVLWMDPENELIFIFLSNRVHPDGKGSVNALAGRIATVAAAAIQDLPGSNTNQ